MRPLTRLGLIAFLVCIGGLSVAYGAVLFNDDFNRTTGLGSNWKITAGNFTTNGVQAVSSGAANYAGVAPSLGTNDYAVESVLIVPAGSLYSGIIARANPSDLSADLYAAQIAGNGKVNLYRRNASVWTLLKSAAAGTVAGAAYTLALKVSGNNPVLLEVSLNGTFLISFSDSSAARLPSGIPGLENYNSGVKYDRFTVSSLTAGNQPPAARIAAQPASGPAPLTVHFDGSASSDPDGTIVSYLWNFGDGSAAGQGAQVDHTYSAPGNFTVTLTVTDNQGAPGSDRFQIAASGGGGATFSDNFDRPNSTVVGPNWNEYIADLEIFGNQLRNATGKNLPTAAVANMAIGPDQDVAVDCKIVLPTNGTDNGNNCALMARWSSESNFYRARLDVGRQNVALFKTVDGTTTLLGSVSRPLQYNTYYRIRLVVQGSALRLFFGDSAVLSVSDASLTAGSFTGLRTFNGLANAAYFDNFSASAATGSPTNRSPIAKIAVNLTAGTAPLAVHFDGSGSSDPDGNVVAYRWSFGDGSISTAGAVVDHTYPAAAGPAPRPGFVERVSVGLAGAEANGDSTHSALSRDGRYIAFESDASNLVPNDTNGTTDVFVYDRETRQTTRVSVGSAGVQGNGKSFGAKISGDGRYVAFESNASNLVDGDTNGATDIFVHDRETHLTTRASVDSAGHQADGNSSYAIMNGDGRYVAFFSFATNLVLNDTNNANDVFVHDRLTGETVRVNVDSSGNQASGGSDSYCPSLSDDGRYVLFLSNAVNLVPGDTNGTYDAFVHDRQTGATVRVSVSSTGVQGNAYSEDGKISADGRFVFFESEATNLVPGDTNGVSDLFFHDRQTGATARASVGSGGAQANGGSFDARISDDGRFGVFESDASNLVSGDTNLLRDIFVRDRVTGATARMTVNADGFEANGASGDGRGSGDGRFVAFNSVAANLVPGDTNRAADLFIVPGPGTYTVTLTVTDNSGATGAATEVIRVDPQGGLSFGDPFDRANSGSLGPSWNEYLTDFEIFSNQLRNANGKNLPVAAVANTAMGPDQDIAVDCLITAPGNSCAIMARWSDANNFYRVRLGVEQGNLAVFKTVNDTTTLLGSVGESLSFNTFYRMRMVVKGSALSIYFNNEAAPALTLTDTALTAGNYAGIRSFATAAGTTFYDNFSASLP